jgi:hypothetical protein
MEKWFSIFFQVVAIITNLSTVFHGAKIYFLTKKHLLCAKIYKKSTDKALICL